MYYAMQLGSLLQTFTSLPEMLETYKHLTAVQRICCTLFDYKEKRYAEGHDFEFRNKNPWHLMP